MRIYEYHDQQPQWRQGLLLSGEWVGLELEVMHEDGNTVAASALDTFGYGTYPAPIAELDGSLSRTYGVEIVCPPLPVSEVLADDGYIARMMRSLQEVGTDEATNGYGMHVNFNVRDWPEHVADIVTYLLCVNRSGTVAAGGRELTPSCDRMPHWILDDGPRVGAIKYAPARIRPPTDNGDEDGPYSPEVIEFRAPSSTLVHGNLKRAIEYVYAIKALVQQQPNKWLAACMLASEVRRIQLGQLVSGPSGLTACLDPAFDVDAYMQAASNIPIPQRCAALAFATEGDRYHDSSTYFESSLAFIRATAEGRRPWETSQAAPPVIEDSGPVDVTRVPFGERGGINGLSAAQFFESLDAAATTNTEFSGGSPIGEQQVGLFEGVESYTRSDGTRVPRQPRITLADFERI